MTSSVKDEVVRLPLDMVEASGGFSVDIGGSMAKIIYRSNKEYKNGKTLDPKEKESGMGRVHAVLFPRAETDAYVKYLREHCDIIPGGTVHGTGTGGSQYKTALEDGLGVVMKNVSEFHCFSTSINTLLEKFPMEEWLLPLNMEGVEEGIKYLKVVKLMQDMAAGRELLTDAEFDAKYRSQVDGHVKRLAEQRKHLVGVPYPYLMVICGSAFVPVLVQEDGSMEMVEVNMVSGRFFLGMSAVLTGEKDYAKIMDMCVNYDGHTVDVMGRDQLSDKADQQEDHYSKLDPNCRIFPFGKGHDVPRESIQDGDLLSSLNQSVCENLALCVFNVARAYNIKDAYFCGGFVSQEVVRRYITKGLAWRNLSIPTGRRVHVEFISNSGQLGSVGAFMYGHKHSKSFN